VLNDQGYEVGTCRFPILPLNPEEKAALYAALGTKEAQA